MYLLPHWQAFTEQVGGYLDAVRAAKDDTVDLLAPEPEQPETDTLYRVQVGAFAEKDNADAMLDRLQKAGFTGYVKKSTAQ